MMMICFKPITKDTVATGRKRLRFHRERHRGTYRVKVSGLYFIFSGHFETQVPLLLKSAQTAQSVGNCPVQPPAHWSEQHWSPLKWLVKIDRLTKDIFCFNRPRPLIFEAGINSRLVCMYVVWYYVSLQRKVSQIKCLSVSLLCFSGICL